MKISCSIIADWDFFRTTFARYRQQRPDRRRSFFIVTAMDAALLLAWIYGRSSGALWTPIAQFALIGAAAGGLGYLMVPRTLLRIRIKRRPNYGATVAVTLDDEGFHTAEPHLQVSIAWPAFTRVVRFEDGLFLTRGGEIRWLPDSALQSSAPDDVLAFVRSKTKVVHAG